MHLDFWGTGEVLAVEQDCGLKRVVARPGIVPIAERVLKTWQEPIQVRAQIVISFYRFPGRQRLIVQVVVVDRLPPGAKIDFFNFRGRGSATEESSFIDFSDPKQRIGTRAILGPFEFPSQFEKAFFGGLQKLFYALFESVRSWARHWQWEG